jgi:hypothetical protein
MRRPCGQTLVAGCTDKSVRLFELATGQEVLRTTLPDAANMAAFAPDGSRVALGIGGLGFPGGTIHILDVATGKERVTLTGQEALIYSLGFGPDGKVLASGLSDTTALLWGVATASPGQRKEELAPATLDALWGDLAGDDAAKAHKAAWTLAANPDASVALLGQRLRAAQPPDPEHIRALIADLDHKEFARRERAARDLKRLGAAAEAALRAEALLESPPLWPPPDADALRRTRAIPVLERIGSPAAMSILEKLARGDPTASETRLAEAARGRLAQHVP